MMERRKRYAVTLLRIYLVIALVLGRYAEGESDSCQIEQRFHGDMVNIKAAKENAVKNKGIVTVPKGSTVNSSSECEQGCCGYDNCTVYLFYPRPPNLGEDKKFNCFYLNCRPQALCSQALVNVSDKAEGSVVGILDLQQGNKVISSLGLIPQVSVSTVAPASDLTSAPTDQPHVDVSFKMTSSPPGTENLASNTEKPSNATTAAETEALVTSMPKKVLTNLYGDNHTTYASLVIALGFGILFLFAAFVLIGRPWWYTFHRPRYSKVDYLMNGL